jgi:putative peptidoglycan lipid II flippase
VSRLLKSSGAVGAATLISRVLGFGREAVYAAFMGVTPEAGAFFYAFTIPNLFRRLLGEGALTAAFIPIFKEKEQAEGDTAMWHATNAVLSGLLVVFGALVAGALLLLTLALWLVPLGWQHELTLRLLRVMFPYVGFVCFAAVFIGLLNARGHYFLPALGAATLNVVMIASVFLLAPWFGATLAQQVFGLAAGVVLAGLVQALCQWPALRREGFRYRWVSPWREPTVRQVLRRMAPATLGVAAYQLNVVITNTIAYAQSEPIVASYNYAVRLMELPQGVVGVSLATYLLTELSGLAAAKRYPEFRGTLRDGVLQLVFLNALATVLLCVLAEPMVRLLFERRSFTPDATARVALALVCLAPGLIAFSLNNILARAFYALGDTGTPMRVSLFCLSANVLFSLFLIPAFRQGGMGLANTASAVLNTALLLYAFRRKQPKFALGELAANAARLAALAAVAGGLAWVAWRACAAAWGTAGLGPRLAGVFLPVTVAALAYFGLALALRLPQAVEFGRLLRRRRPDAAQA